MLFHRFSLISAVLPSRRLQYAIDLVSLPNVCVRVYLLLDFVVLHKICNNFKMDFSVCSCRLCAVKMLIL